ncbi:MAG: hypothetical protein CVU09_15975 [Bacteroidetes bacterium HGW-Bacteroidetes-4]|jgi:hypothetical protein|nr:MAG: hypothetical protein CVU09_15975 [Bacteroidetes bacterium HGW-Bacteroidetes-4]
MKKIKILAAITIILSIHACRKSDYILPENTKVISDKGSGTGTTTWTKDLNLLLEGFVFVNEGQTLSIEPGTVVRFKSGQGATASALIVARGGKILAKGTKEAPIIFTAESDKLDGSMYNHSRGLWGGLILLGNAPINTDSGTDFIEGIPTTEPRGEYGGHLPDDNSGELCFVSIRYPGTALHQGNEINGLTLGGVGNQTLIENVEIINSADDGIEVFGGTVNLKNIISFGASDDAFDYDMGYQGNVQFLLAIQSDSSGQNLIEGSGALDPVYHNPISKPVFSNLTLIGAANTSGNMLVFDRYAGGIIVNSILVNKNKGVVAEYTNASTDSYAQFKTGHLIIENNLFDAVAGNISDSIFTLYGASIPPDAKTEWQHYFNLGNNTVATSGVEINGNKINLFPTLASDQILYTLPDDWFETTNFKGAFGTYDWTKDWSSFSAYLLNP